MPPYGFAVFEDDAGQFRFRLRSRNGEIVSTSESYTSKTDAERGVVDMARTVLGEIFDALAPQNSISAAHPAPVRIGADAARACVASLADGLENLGLVS